MKKRPTIVDIARESGFDKSTVSRALRKDPLVNEKTREAILEISRKFNYMPHRGARLFKDGRTKILGVFTEYGPWMFTNNYFGPLLKGLHDGAAAKGYRLLFCVPQCAPASERRILMEDIESLMDGQMDGAVILGGDTLTAEMHGRMKQACIPFVFLNNLTHIPGFSQIMSGAGERISTVAQSLKKSGCKNLGMLGLRDDSHYLTVCRQGLEAAAQESGMIFKSEWQATLELNSEFRVTEEAFNLKLNQLLDSGVDGLILSETIFLLWADLLIKERSQQSSVKLASFGPLPYELYGNADRFLIVETDLVKAGGRCFEMFLQALEENGPQVEKLNWTEGSRFKI